MKTLDGYEIIDHEIYKGNGFVTIMMNDSPYLFFKPDELFPEGYYLTKLT